MMIKEIPLQVGPVEHKYPISFGQYEQKFKAKSDLRRKERLAWRHFLISSKKPTRRLGDFLSAKLLG
jgi:hypothetical protein